jgi:hypothetical protein
VIERLRAVARRPLFAVCALAWVAALVLRALAGARAGSLYPDGAVELDLARALAEGRLHDALSTRFHPLFGLLVAPLVALGLPAEGAAQAVSALVSSCVAPLAAVTAARLAPGAPLRAAALAGLLAAVHPWLVRLGGQVMAYGTAHAALALALALGVRAVARPGWRSGAAAGAAIGLGWLARSDALATGAGLALGVTLATLRAAGPRPAGRVAAGLCLAALIVMSPYLAAMRVHTGEWRLSLKKRVSDVVRVPDPPRPVSTAPVPPTALGLGLGLEGLLQLETAGGDEALMLEGQRARTPPALDAAVFALRKAASAAHPLLLLLAAAGLLVARGPARWLAPLAAASFVAVHALLKANWGYTSVLHQSALGVLVAPLAGVGAAWLYARARGLPALRAALALAALFALAHKATEPQLRGKEAERAVGPFLRGLAGPGPLVIAGRDARVVAHDARASYIDVRDVPGPPVEALAALRARGARYLVLYLRRRRGAPDEDTPRLDAALAPLGVSRIGPAFEGEGEGGARYDWLVFRLEP